MLHLAGGVALGVDVGDLLQLQGAFERQRIGGAAAEIEDIAGERDFGGDLLDRLVVVQDFAGARRHLGELAGEPGLLRGVDRAARPRHRDREGGEDSELRRKGLGRGDADLGAGEGRQDHIAFARDRALGLVDDCDDLLAGLAAITQCRQRIGRLAGLRNDDRRAVARHRRRAIAELGGDIGLDRNPRQGFEPVFRNQPGMVRGAAGEQGDLADIA